LRPLPYQDITTEVSNQVFQLYKQNREWELLNAEMKRRSEVFEGSTANFIELVLTMSRHSATHKATVVIPAFGEHPSGRK
jgi:hypothetical protein